MTTSANTNYEVGRRAEERIIELLREMGAQNVCTGNHNTIPDVEFTMNGTKVFAELKTVLTFHAGGRSGVAKMLASEAVITANEVRRVVEGRPYVRCGFVVKKLGVEDTHAARVTVATRLREIGWVQPPMTKHPGRAPRWRPPEREPLMKFWNVRRLAEEFHLPRITIGKLLSSLGAKKWTDSGGHCSAVWYWEDEP